MEINHRKIMILYLLFILQLQNLFVFVNLELLNNIIKLSDTHFIHNHFSFNSEGDMIIDTESPNESSMLLNERKFYGIKKNGKEYFTDKTGKKSYYSPMITKNSYGRN